MAHKVNSTQEDISGGEVTVDDPLCLEVFHGVCNLSGVGVEQLQVLAGSVLPQECVEITVRSQFLYLCYYSSRIQFSLQSILGV